MDALKELLIIFVTLIAFISYYFKRSFSYWQRRNVPSIPASFPFGNMSEQLLGRKSQGEIQLEIYQKAKGMGEKFVGIYMFHQPWLLVVDPELVKDILSRDFEYFHDRRVLVDEKNDPLTGHLVVLKGTKWKNLRSKLTPFFTSGKMKMMFHTMTACSKELGGILDKHVIDEAPVNIKELLGRFTTDIIGSCAFGIECNSLKDPNNIFRQYGKKIFDLPYLQLFKMIFCNTFPRFSQFFGIKRIPQDIEDFFMDLVERTVKYREENNIERADFMHLMIQMKNSGNDQTEDGKSLTLAQMAANAFVFFLAGFETSATTMTFVLYDLAIHEDVQEKVRAEVERMFEKYGGELCYEGIMELTYMDKVIQESQRLHSPIPILGRICTKDYQIKGTKVVIEKDTMVFVPVIGLQNDPEYYPDPEKFDPERFRAEEKVKRHPYTFLPFGEGPRNCIGLRFGLLQSKVGLAVVLRRHRFKLSPKTKTPFRYDPKSVITSVRGDIWLEVDDVI